MEMESPLAVLWMKRSPQNEESDAPSHD